MKEYLQTSAAARELIVSEQTIRSLADNGKVKIIRTAAGIRLYDADDVRSASRNFRKEGLYEPF
jgi:DNA-binding transcriptional MerR regulator